MKFYRDINNYSLTYNKIIDNKLTAVYLNFYNSIRFFKNGKFHNYKKATFIETTGYKAFYLNDQYYGNNTQFTKSSWRKLVKMQAFL